MKLNNKSILKAIFVSYITITVLTGIIGWLIIFLTHLLPSFDISALLRYTNNIFVTNLAWTASILIISTTISTFIFLHLKNKS
jgi:hypothetical protein